MLHTKKILMFYCIKAYLYIIIPFQRGFCNFSDQIFVLHIGNGLWIQVQSPAQKALHLAILCIDGCKQPVQIFFLYLKQRGYLVYIINAVQLIGLQV